MSDTTPTIEVHTIRFGHAWWLEVCTPTLDRWCRIHRHSLNIWTRAEINPNYPSAKFCQIDMLKGFLKGTADWLFYVDADVYVDADAPGNPFEGKSGFLMREDMPGVGPRQFSVWVRRHMGRPALREIDGWTYCNAGVWACDRKAARKMMAVIEPPYIEGIQEQHQWNWWINRAVRTQGMQFSHLSKDWNHWWHENDPGFFYHIVGRNKSEKLAGLRRRGLIPQQAKPTFSPERVRAVVLSPEHYGKRRERFFQSIEKHGGWLRDIGVQWVKATPLDQLFVPVGRFYRRMHKRPHYWAASHDHLAILERAILDEVEFLLVFEDDACLCDDFCARLEAAVALLPADWRALQLHWNARKESGPWDGIQGPSTFRAGMMANLWTREGMIRFHSHAWCQRNLVIDGSYEDLKRMEPSQFFRTARQLVLTDSESVGGGVDC